MLFRIPRAYAVVLVVVLLLPQQLLGAPFTVNSVGTLAPNPYGLNIISNTTNMSATPGGTGLTLASFQALLQGDNGAFARDNGGVLDAQQIWQGGSWPANAGGNNNGATMGDTSASPITVTYGATQANTIQFWRDTGATLNSVGIDSNITNGNQVVSGGGQSPSGGGSGSINFATGIFNDNTETGSVTAGGGYIGIQGAFPVGLVFNNGVAPVATPVSNVTAFAITEVPRFAARNFQIVATFSGGTTFDTGLIAYPNDGTTANFVGIQAPAGETISRIDLLGTLGLTRFDDMAFITTAPSDTGGWQLNTGASWNSTGSWATGVVPNAVGAAASFRGALTTSGNISLDGTKTVGQIVFVNAAASYSIVPGSGGSLTIDNTGGAGAPSIAADAGTHSINVPIVLTNSSTQVYVDNDAKLNIGSNISDTGASNIVKLGNGPATLSGTNTYTGTTTINLGTLNATKPASLPGFNAAGRVVVSAGGTLAVSVGGVGRWQSADIDTLLANATFAAHQAITPSRVGFDTTGGNFTYASNIAGNQGIDKFGSNTLVLSGANTYAGPTRILSGTLSVASISGNLGVPFAAAGDFYSGVIGVGSGTTGGTLLYTGTSESVVRIIDMTGTTGGATIDQSGTGALIFNTNSGLPGGTTLATSTASVTASGNGNKTLTLQGSTTGTGELRGAIIDHQTAANAQNPDAITSVVKAGTGTWTISGTNTYTGNTSIIGGILILGSTNAAQNSRVISAANNGLQFAPFIGSFKVGSLSDQLDNTPAGDIALVDNDTIPLPVALTVANAAGQATTYSGKLTGAGSLLLSNGSLTLKGNNTYSGGTTINGGTLIVGSDTALGASSGSLILNSGALNATLNLNGHSVTVGALSGSGGTITNSVGGATTLSVGDGTPLSQFFGTISDGSGGSTMSLVKNGNGALSFGSSNTYSGTTRINRGTLQLGTPTAINSTSNLVLAGGKLDTSGNSPTFTTPLSVLANSAIDLAGVATVQFATTNASAWTAGSTVSVLHWTGTPGPAGSGNDKIIFGNNNAGLTNANLGATNAKIHFQGYNGADILATGEVVPHAASTLPGGGVLGDFNVNGALDSGDITTMLKALTDLNAYKLAGSPLHPSRPIALTNDDLLNIGDVNLSGNVDNTDIQAELDLLASVGLGSVASVPEPSALILLATGAMVIGVRRRSALRHFGKSTE